MSGVTSVEAELGIGELARRTGVPVRTIRFYCDQGLLTARRSAGGHRRFAAASVDQLTLARRLRALGLGLPSIGAVLAGHRSVAEAVAAERAALDVELAALAWRRATLHAVAEAGPAERTARLALLAAVPDPGAGYEALVSFWRRWFAAPPPADLFDMLVAVGAPRPPPDPTPTQAVAFAELVALATDRSLAGRMAGRARANRELGPAEPALHAALGEACALATPMVAAGTGPGPGPALDLFVAAHAAARGARDTPGFRRELHAGTAVDRDPRLRRYWRLVGEVTGEPVNVGTAYTWLLDALTGTVPRLVP